MSLAPQQFCVRWNSYHTNLQTVFPKLLTTENFVDVTLACENRQIKCHKVVLSACSTYFERLLIQNPCKHPIIFMKDMRFSEMQSLVDFMYKGEVNVSQDDLPSLLKSAEALQIRGLCGSDSGGLGGSQSGCESESPIHTSSGQHHTKNSEASLNNEKPISPAFKDASNSASKSSTLDQSWKQSSDQAGSRTSSERLVIQPNSRPTANSIQISPPAIAPASTRSQVANNTASNTSTARNHLQSSSTTTRQMSLLKDLNGETNPSSGGITGETSGVFKEETVEEDGLFYGEMENDDMECGDQTEEDLLQTGSSGLPNSDDNRKSLQLRVKSKSDLFNKRSIESLQYPLMNKIKKSNQLSNKTFPIKEFKNRTHCTTTQNNNFDLSNLVVKNPDCNIDINILNNPNKRLKHDHDEKTSLDSISNGVVRSENSHRNNDESINELAYEDEEYLKLWLAQNQELEVSLSTGALNDSKFSSKTKIKDNSLKGYQKISNDRDEKKWLQYYTGELPMPKKSHNINFVGVTSVNKKKNKQTIIDGNILDPNVDLVDLLMPSDLEQFLAGKEVSSSGISRKAIEQAMMGKYNPNRRYSNQAMWAALMDVKQGGSIYRAAQTHKVPRKSLRNWMKRWHIKSSFPMPQQLKQFVENNKKHKVELTREHILSYNAHNQLLIPDQIPEKITIKGENDNNDPEVFKHFLEMSHEFFRSGLQVVSSEEDDIANVKKSTESNSNTESDVNKTSQNVAIKIDEETFPEDLSKVNDVEEKASEKEGEFSQIMDMSGNILFDDNVVASVNHEDSHNEDDYLFKDEPALLEPSVVAEDSFNKTQQLNKVTVLKKHVLFSNVEQLAGLDELQNVDA